ncbi:MAG TPA: hypothetical protein VMB52_00055, partial [Verrucomicrobiae bacterium]|nr:hypothetical protein [Verrucomicrobiae bacterium]
ESQHAERIFLTNFSRNTLPNTRVDLTRHPSKRTRLGRTVAAVGLALLAAGCTAANSTSSAQPTPPPTAESTAPCGELAPPKPLGGGLDSNHALPIENVGGPACVYGHDGKTIIGIVPTGTTMEAECRAPATVDGQKLGYIAMTAPSINPNAGGLTGSVELDQAAEAETAPGGPLFAIPLVCSGQASTPVLTAEFAGGSEAVQEAA